MPAVSEKQRRTFGAALQYKRKRGRVTMAAGLKKLVAKIAGSMSEEKIRHYASKEG